MGADGAPATVLASLGRSAGFDGHDCGVDAARTQSPLDAGDDSVGGDGAMSEEHLDDGAGAVAVTPTAAGLNPEPLMGRPEHTRARARASGVAETGAGLDGQHLQVVVQHQHLVTFAAPGVAGHDQGPVEDLNGLGTDPDIEPLAHVAGGHRIQGAPDRHPALGVHPVGAHHADVERPVRQRAQRVGLEREVLGHAETPLGDEPLVVLCAASGESSLRAAIESTWGPGRGGGAGTGRPRPPRRPSHGRR